MSTFYRDHGKRILDIVFGLCALPFVAASFVVAAPLIKLDDGGPIFYAASRRGCKGSTFQIYKYRSMKVNSPILKAADGSTLSSDDDPRLTRVGRMLRKTSLDEFPQFINVLKGDMSIVGPRPNLVSIPYEALDEVQKKRLVVRPGVTGYNQAYFRNSVSMEQKFENDCYYVDHVSLIFDIRIFFKTIGSVLRSRGVANTNAGEKEIADETSFVDPIAQ